MAGEEILIADDEAAMRLAIRKALQREVLRVTEALELLRRGKFALVILDVMMPDVSGYDVIQSMRGRGTTRRLWCFPGNPTKLAKRWDWVSARTIT